MEKSNQSIPETIGDEQHYIWSHSEIFADNFCNHVCLWMHKNYTINMHTHNFFEINIVTSGTGRHFFNNKYVDVKQGNIFVISPNTKHGYYSIDHLEVFHIMLSDAFFYENVFYLSQLSNFDFIFSIEETLRGASRKIKLITIEDSDFMVCIKKIYELIEIFKPKTVSAYIMTNYATMSFICYLCSIITPRSTSIKPTIHNDEIYSTVEYMHNNYGEKITLSQLAQMSFLSIPQYIRIFNNYFSTTPMQYLQSVRLIKAKQLIQYSAKSITEIAQQCGFYDLSHFEKYFKQKYGVSPWEIRSNSKINQQ